MYGLLLENLAMFIKLQWGEVNWDAVRRHAGIDASTFHIHHVYAETIIPRLARSAVQVLGVEEKIFMEAMGVYFVEFVGQFGYDQVMSVLGRHMRDFLNGLDNLHEYLKYSFPKMRAPSFFCDNETMSGLTLHYRSKRRGFVHYAMGQIKQVAKHFYDCDCEIEFVSEELDGDTMHVIFQLSFDNRAYIKTESMVNLVREDQLLPFRTSLLFELFPFCIVFSDDMMIKHIGRSLYLVMPDLVGLCITETFEVIRPLIGFTMHTILDRRNNIFELVSVAPINDDELIADGSMEETAEDTGTFLHLKGQMLYMDDWQSMMFLATPVMPDLEALLAAGLFINDLSLHDCSRDLILAGTQQSQELKSLLEQEQMKSKKLEDSMKKLDDEMRKTDELLYQMIPRQVADRIRLGENPVETCEVYEVVSILFSDVVTFTEICSRINPMQVVSMLNHMYSLFDQLTERNGVYKVETIGDAYMVVSGAPNQEANHAERICDMAMDMVDASMGIFDPSRDGEHLQLRVGVHSGNVVAGVVGLKMPRWCLFGDAVNTSSRMESTSEAGRIQISAKTMELLPDPYEREYRGEVPMKGKGMMKTYWLTGRQGRIPLSQLQCNTFSWAAPQMSIFTEGGGNSSAASARSGGPGTFGKEKSLSISDSERGAPSKHDHPHLTHQHSSASDGKMHLDAAKQAVNKSLMMRKQGKVAAEQKAEDKKNADEKVSSGLAPAATDPTPKSPAKRAPQAEPPKQEPPKAEPPKAEPPKAEPANVAAPKVDPSKVEPPKVEPPKVVQPKVEPPKVEQPKVEPPKVEPRKVEPPKAEASKSVPAAKEEGNLPSKAATLTPTTKLEKQENVVKAAKPAPTKAVTLEEPSSSTEPSVEADPKAVNPDPAKKPDGKDTSESGKTDPGSKAPDPDGDGTSIASLIQSIPSSFGG